MCVIQLSLIELPMWCDNLPIWKVDIIELKKSKFRINAFKSWFGFCCCCWFYSCSWLLHNYLFYRIKLYRNLIQFAIMQLKFSVFFFFPKFRDLTSARLIHKRIVCVNNVHVVNMQCIAYNVSYKLHISYF